MGLHFRKVLRVGPFRFNIGRKGVTSTTVRFGLWSWNSRTRRQTVNLPGPFWFQTRGRGRK